MVLGQSLSGCVFWGRKIFCFVLAEQEVDLLADEQRENTWKGKEM